MTPTRRLTGELLGTALLLAAVVGSGIMGERLSGGNVAIALLANTLATGAMLVTLIFTFGAVSGAHFNPAVTLADASQGGMRCATFPATSWRKPRARCSACGLLISCSRSRCYRYRSTLEQEAHRFSANSSQLSDCSPLSGAAGGYARRPCPSQPAYTLPALNWFTASTSFANPAVTLARAFTNTFPVSAR